MIVLYLRVSIFPTVVRMTFVMPVPLTRIYDVYVVVLEVASWSPTG